MATRKGGEADRTWQEATRVFPKVTTLDAKKLGLSLKVDDKTLKKLDEIQEETIKAAQEDQKFSWR